MTVLLLAYVLDNIGASDSTDAGPGKTTIAEIENTIRRVYQSDLEDRRRAPRARGTIAVVDVECGNPELPVRLILCLAQVVATGEARSITALHVPIRVRRHGPDDFGFRSIERHHQPPRL